MSFVCWSVRAAGRCVAAGVIVLDVMPSSTDVHVAHDLGQPFPCPELDPLTACDAHDLASGLDLTSHGAARGHGYGVGRSRGVTALSGHGHVLHLRGPIAPSGCHRSRPGSGRRASWYRRPMGMSHRIRFVATVVATTFAVACVPNGPPVPPSSPTGCNGSDLLCDRSYDDVAYVTTHNAMSSDAYGFAGPNQSISLTGQLDAGVRALMLDVHQNDDSSFPTPHAAADAVLLCHVYCGFGFIDLAAGLTEIRSWLDAHPREVITLILENYVGASSLETAMASAGLLPRLATHLGGTAWPTLRQLVESNRRVVVMTDSQGGQRPWLLPVFSETWDTNYSAATTSDLSCAVNRGSFGNQMIILNNFLTNPLSSPLLADQANTDPFLASRVVSCRAAWGGRLPNFVTVDFFERGVVTQTVRALNGI